MACLLWVVTRASLLPKDGEMLPLRLNQQCQELVSAVHSLGSRVCILRMGEQTTKKRLYQETGRPFTPIFETRAWIKNLHQAPDGS